MVYIIIITGYIILYAGMIVYDLFHRDQAEVVQKTDEVEIDISQEAGEFHPIEVSKDEPVKAQLTEAPQQPQKTEEAPNNESPRQERQSKDHPEATPPHYPTQTLDAPQATKPEAATKPEQTQTPETTDRQPQPSSQEASPTEESQRQQDTPAPPADDKTDTAELNDNDYSGAKAFDDLMGEIESFSKDDPDLQDLAYEVERIDME